MVAAEFQETVGVLLHPLWKIVPLIRRDLIGESRNVKIVFHVNRQGGWMGFCRVRFELAHALKSSPQVSLAFRTVRYPNPRLC